jgi:hypothetical protein
MISPSQSPLPENTQLSQQMDIHVPDGIWTCNPSKPVSSNLCITPHGHRGSAHYSLAYIEFCQSSRCLVRIAYKLFLCFSGEHYVWNWKDIASLVTVSEFLLASLTATLCYCISVTLWFGVINRCPAFRLSCEPNILVSCVSSADSEKNICWVLFRNQRTSLAV